MADDLLTDLLITLRSQELGTLVELKHVNDAPCLRRPKTFIATALFIIKTITKNFTIR
jgi:hypothetical protein